MSLTVPTAEFLAGIRSLERAKVYPWPEVAVIGRSNVGKSTFINAVAQRKKLAHSSSTPGSTREINFFHLEGRLYDAKVHVTLADLPGFGYAKFSKKEREETERLIVEYLRGRKLKAIFLLNDCRRPAGEQEIALRDLAVDEDIPLIIVATKVDTLKKNPLAKSVAELAESYSLEPGDLLLSGTDRGPEPFWRLVQNLIS